MRRVAIWSLLLILPSLGWAALPAGELWREGLLAHRVGYGRLATGGAGGTLCTVNTLADSGGSGQTGSLRHCLTLSGPQWIIFSVSGTITLSSQIHLHGFSGHSDKTIDGRGQNIVINGHILINDTDNLIIHNISIQSASDGFRLIGGSQTIWFDHVSCTAAGDECFDFDSQGGDVANVAAQFLTISWSRFSAKPPASGNILVCSDPSLTECIDYTLTIHHTWFDHGGARHPFMRRGKIHSFNNFMDNVDIGAEARTLARFVSEHDIFQCDAYGGSGPPAQCGFSGIPLRIKCQQGGSEWTVSGDSNASTCKVTNPWLVTATETFQQLNQGSSFDPAADYSYAAFLETADAALRTKLTHATTGAGRVDNPYNYLAAGEAVLIAHYTFDEGTGTTPQDTSGNNLDGVITGGATYVAGRVGSGALSFNGTTGVVTVADNALLDLSTGFTLAAWVNPAALHTDARAVVVKGYVYYLYASGFGAGTNQPLGGYESGGSQAITDVPALPANVWTHLAVTYDGATLALYRDGQLDISASHTGTIAATTGTLTIGSSEFDEFFNGLIDDVQIYNGALDATEVLALFNSGLVGWWKLDETSGTTAADFSGNSFTGTLTNMESPGDWVAGQVDGALNFDGTNEYVTIADDSLLSPVTTGQFSVCAWVWVNALPASQGIIVGKGTDSNYEYVLRVNSSGTAAFNLWDLSGTDHSVATSAATVPIAAWRHLCGTYEAAVETIIYINGASSGSSTSFVGTLGNGTSPVEFGRRPDNALFFNGRIDDVRLYHHALSAVEVEALFDAGDTAAALPAAPTNLRIVSP